MYNNNYYQSPKGMMMPNNSMYQQPMYQPMYQMSTSQSNNGGLLGKMVDSIEVVKSLDIPLDGSTSFFPIADGSSIVTKQLQNDGTSKITIYKPIEEEKESVNYITQEELDKSLRSIDLSELDDLKEELKELRRDFKEIQKKIKSKGD